MAFNLSGVLSLDSSKFTSGIGKAKSEMSGLSSEVNKSKGILGSFSSSLTGIAKNSDTAKSGLSSLTSTISKLAVGAGLIKLSKDSVQIASDLSEVKNVVETTFGDSSSAIEEFSKSAGKSFGISRLQAQQYTGTIGSMMKASGITGDELKDMSVGLAGLAGDIASFNNLSPDEAFEKLKSVVTGSTEPLESIGLNMQVATLESYAMSKGITKSFEKMSQAEKVALRYNFVMDKTKDTQGDFAKTSDGLANQMRILTLNTTEVKTSIGEMMLPAINSGVTAFNGFMESLRNGDSPFQGIINRFKSMYEEHSPAFQSALSSLKDGAIQLVENGLNAMNNAIGWVETHGETVKSAIIGLGVALGVYKTICIASTAAQALNNIQSGIAAIKNGALTASIVGLYIAEGVGTAVTWGLTAAQTALNIAMLANPIGLVVVAVTALVGGIVVAYNKVEWFREAVNNCWETIKGWGQSIKEVFSDSWLGKGIEKMNEFMSSVGKVNTPDIDANANGTSYFQGGLTHYNERGGEIAQFPNGTTIVPADRSKEMTTNGSLNGGKNITVHMSIDARGMNVNELADVLEMRLNNM